MTERYSGISRESAGTEEEKKYWFEIDMRSKHLAGVVKSILVNTRKKSVAGLEVDLKVAEDTLQDLKAAVEGH